MDEGQWVEARDGESGELRWRAALSADTWGPLAVHGGVVYGINAVGEVFALDAADGRLLWDEPYTSISGDSGPVLTAGPLVFTGSQALSAHDAATGRMLWWKQGADECNGCSPAFSRNVLYFGVRRLLLAVDARTGRTKWSHRLPPGSSWGAFPALGATVVFAPAMKVTDLRAKTASVALYALTRRTGALVWKAPVARWDAPPASAPAVTADVVYLASRDGALYAFRARSGTRLWRARLDGPTSSSPAVANGVVYVGGRRELFAFDAKTGRWLWSAELSADRSPSSPAVAGGAVFVSSSGTLYRFDIAAGGTS